MSKLKARQSAWLHRAQTQSVLRVLNQGTAVTRCVGGCVRDALMGHATQDTEVDMATDMTPDEVISRLAAVDIKTAPTGIKHGTVSAIVYDGEQPLVYEITTLRLDVETDGRHAQTAFTQDWQGDAARRDFTINALYADADGTLHDPTGMGVDDIRAKRVRFIGDAEQRIGEDYLRVLRYFRFHFALTPDAPPQGEALAACRAAAAHLRGLSGERKQAEIMKIMALPASYRAVRAMRDTDVLRPVLGIEPVDFAMLEAIVEMTDDPLIRLMSLLPSTDAGHVLAVTLRLSKKHTMRVMAALEMPLNLARLRHALYFAGPEAVCDRAMLALAAGQGDPQALKNALDEAAQFNRPKFPLTGAIMQSAGIASGPEMGVMSKALEQWWVDEGFPDADAVRAELRRRLS